MKKSLPLRMAVLVSLMFSMVTAVWAAIPSITSFSPLSGEMGTTVTITGTNFNTTPDNNVVFFGAAKATVNSATETSLSVKVPAGATYQPISVTDITSGLSAYSKHYFTTTFDGGDIVLSSIDNRIDSTTNTSPTSIITADLDDDGKVDIVIASNITKSFSVHRNTSSGNNISFGTRIDFSFGTTSTANKITSGDIDGDGKLDIVAALTSGKIGVFRNTSSNGNVSFASMVEFFTSGYTDLAVGDLDGDGKPDVVVVDPGNYVVSISRNTSSIGSISFASNTNLSTGYTNLGFLHVLLGDLDNDNKLEIITSNKNYQSVSVWRNQSNVGLITFAARVDFTTPVNPYGLSLGDIDGDGKLDLAVAAGGSTISVLRNTSTGFGSIAFANKVDYATPGAFYIKINDMNGDGKPDVVCANVNSYLTMFRNLSSSGYLSFAPKVDFDKKLNEGPQIAIADFDNDGKSDVAIANMTSSTVSIFRNKVTGPTRITSFNPTNGSVGTTVIIKGSNFNTNTADNIVRFGSVKAEVSEASADSLKVTVPSGATYKNISVTNAATQLTGYSAKPFITTFLGTIMDNDAMGPKVDFTTGLNAQSVDLADIDGDGKSDMITANQGANTISVLRNTGIESSIDFVAKVDFTTGTTPTKLTVGDVDGDGKLDVITVNSSGNTLSILRNTSTSGTISFAPKYDISTENGPISIAVGDINVDGKIDIAITYSSLNKFAVFRNTTVGTTFSFIRTDVSTGLTPVAIAIDDIDGDGKPEVAITNFTDKTISVFRNTSTVSSISFAPKTDFSTSANPLSVAIGDIDGDGKLDIVSGVVNSMFVTVLRNTSGVGSISFATKVEYTTGTNSSVRNVKITDVDGDGKLDVIASDNYNSGALVYKNTSTSGTISLDSFLNYQSNSGPLDLTVGDINNDGKPDIIVLGSGISVLKNNMALPLPTISSFTPTSASIGTTVTITGSHFMGATAVRFGGTDASWYTVLTDTTINAEVASGSTGDVSVTTPAGTATLGGFTLLNSQMITDFDSIPLLTYGDASITLFATGGASGNPVVFTSSNTSVADCTGTNGTTLTIQNAGVCTIYANQAGNSEYLAAPQVFQTILINKKELTVTAEDTTKVYGTINPVFRISYFGFVSADSYSDLDVLPIASCLADETSAPGEYDINLNGGSDNNYSYLLKKGKLTVTPGVVTSMSGSGFLSSDVYPNPVKDFLYVDNISGEVLVNVYTLQGVLLKQAILTSHFRTINMSDLDPGSYIVQFNRDNATTIVRIIVQ